MPNDLTVDTTPIPDLLVVRLPLHEDSRGWFKENWQREKMVALGVPDFGPVQNNMSMNAHRGATRGIHTEPWDKLVSVANGRVFAAWIDMREGPSFGEVFYLEMGPDTAVFVPRGVGNSYQALEDGTVYSYLVNDHWRPGISYPALHLGDVTCAIPWPIPLTEAEISEKDHANPTLDAVTPVPPKKTLIIGANGQLGRALHVEFPHADLVDLVADPDRGVGALDASDPTALAAIPWRDYGVVLNAAAYTAVDAAETSEGRIVAWRVNATAPSLLARAANEHGFTLVHYSSEYVFDGTRDVHTEDEPLSPLGVYAQSKAAGDVAVSLARDYYLLRTSWVVGDGPNFVRTMHDLAKRGVSPTVVKDQLGRLTFTAELARATAHLLGKRAECGTYNVTNAGAPMTWFDVATDVFTLSGRNPEDVKPTTTEAYANGRHLAPRPRHSVLDLSKLEAIGFVPRLATDNLVQYVSALNGDCPTQ